MFQEFDDVIVITLLVLHHQRIAVLRSRGALRLPRRGGSSGPCLLALRATFVAHRGKRRRGVRRVTGSEKSSRRRRAHGFFFALRIRGEDLRRRRFRRRARLGRRTLLTRVSHRRIVSNSSAHVSIRRDRSRHLPRRSSREGRLAFRHRRAPRRRLVRGFPRRRFRQRRRITISDHRRLVRVERHRLVIILLSLRRHRLPHRRPLLYVFILEHDEFVRRPSSPDRRTRRFHRRRRRRHRSPAIAHGRLPRLIPVALRLQSLRASARLFQIVRLAQELQQRRRVEFPIRALSVLFPRVHPSRRRQRFVHVVIQHAIPLASARRRASRRPRAGFIQFRNN